MATDPNIISSLQNGIAQEESGGDYSALGKTTSSGDRGYGKYQIMGSNIPQWTKDVTGTASTPEDFLKNPQLQDQVASKKISDYYNQYGNPSDVASAWFTGGPLSQNAGKSDINGTSTPQYVKNVLKNMGGNKVLGETVQTPDATPLPQATNDTIKQNVLKLQNAGATPQDIETYVKSAVQEGGQSNTQSNPQPNTPTTPTTPTTPNADTPNSKGFINSANLPPAPSSDNSNPGVIGNLLNGNVGGAAQDFGSDALNMGSNAIQDFFNFSSYGGTKQLGNYIGTNMAEKGPYGKYVDPTGGSSADYWAGTGKSLAGVASSLPIGDLFNYGGKILKGLLSSSEFDHPVIQSAFDVAKAKLPPNLSGTIDEAVNGGKNVVLSAGQRLNAIVDALKTAPPNEARVLNKVLPLAQKASDIELGIATFAERNPGLVKAATKTGQIAKGLAKGALFTGATVAGVGELGNLWNGVTKYL